MQPIPRFDELHVISDLHLGGTSGFQIFDQGRALAALVRQLRDRARERKVCLVINGDLVDFLAEPGATWFDPEGAISRLERIAGDPAFSPVFEALPEFLQVPGAFLAITLGNHDLELALPWVRERLMDLLAGGDPAARLRIALAFDGSGFRCQVGTESVLCVHGNEVDEWNVTDHEQIRRIGRDLVQGRTPNAWKPNAGTRMVIEVMNEIKREHPFVDLLKPEFQAAVPALLILRPALAERIADIGGVVLRMSWDRLRMRFGFLSAEPSPNAPERARVAELRPPGMDIVRATPQRETALRPQAVLRELLSRSGPDAAKILRSTTSSMDLLMQAEQSMRDGREPLDLIAAEDEAARLGFFDAAWKHLRGTDPCEVLRAALEGVPKHRAFDLALPDDTFRRLDDLIGPGIRFVVSGHTHLRRALKRQRGGFYYNTGTWARLMQITESQLTHAPDFQEVFRALSVPTLAELDRSSYVERHLTAALIEADGHGTRGSLREFTLDDDGTLHATTVEGSAYPSA